MTQLSLIGRIPQVKLIINRLCLSQDVIDLIKDFIFVHPEQQIKKVKEIYNDIIEIFNKCKIYCWLSGKWLMYFPLKYKIPQKKISARNCIVCGNYQSSKIFYRYLPEKIKCLCLTKKKNKRNNSKWLANRLKIEINDAKKAHNRHIKILYNPEKDEGDFHQYSWNI